MGGLEGKHTLVAIFPLSPLIFRTGNQVSFRTKISVNQILLESYRFASIFRVVFEKVAVGSGGGLGSGVLPPYLSHSGSSSDPTKPKLYI